MMFPFKAPFVPDFSSLDYSMNGIWSSAVWVKDFWRKRATVSQVDPTNDGVGYDLQTTGCYLSWLNIELYQIWINILYIIRVKHLMVHQKPLANQEAPLQCARKGTQMGFLVVCGSPAKTLIFTGLCGYNPSSCGFLVNSKSTKNGSVWCGRYM